MSLPLFLITQRTMRVYDSYDSHVIAAGGAREVRTMAKQRAADEGEGCWDTATVSKIATVSCYKRPRVVLSSFNAG